MYAGTKKKLHGGAGMKKGPKTHGALKGSKKATYTGVMAKKSK